MQLSNVAVRSTPFTPRGVTGVSKSALTVEDVERLLAYDADTGALTWRESPRYGIPAGSVAGCPNRRGYIVLTLLGFKCTAHRLAWLLHYREWPKQVIDHINRDKADNRIANLRDVAQAVNVRNRVAIVSAGKAKARIEKVASGRFRAVVQVLGKKHYFGTFDTRGDASDAATAALAKFQ